MPKRIRIGHIRPSTEQLIEIARKLNAEERARRLALGVPQGFEIPEKPLPTTLEALEAELVEVDRIATESLHKRMATPRERQDQEYHAWGWAMHRAQYRLFKLQQLRREWGRQ
jgi:hypothetical protein